MENFVIIGLLLIMLIAPMVLTAYEDFTKDQNSSGPCGLPDTYYED